MVNLTTISDHNGLRFEPITSGLGKTPAQLSDRIRRVACILQAGVAGSSGH
jgi:hypothetical protein